MQKKLIAKFKVKNPTPLSNLETLVQDTFNEIMSAAEELDYANGELTKAQIELSCALSIIQNLLKIMDIDKELKKILVSTFCSDVQDMDFQVSKICYTGCFLMACRNSRATKINLFLRPSFSSSRVFKQKKKQYKIFNF